jgi:hypothetical protein
LLLQLLWHQPANLPTQAVLRQQLLRLVVTAEVLGLQSVPLLALMPGSGQVWSGCEGDCDSSTHASEAVAPCMLSLLQLRSLWLINMRNNIDLKHLRT